MSRKLLFAIVLAPFLATAAYAQVTPPPTEPPAAADEVVNLPDVRTETESIDDGKIVEDHPRCETSA